MICRKTSSALILALSLVSQQSHATELKDFLQEISSLKEQTLNHFSPNDCQSELRSLNQQLEAISFPDYDQKAMVDHTNEIIDTLWNLHLSLRAPLAEYPSECIPTLRQSFYDIRSLIDYVGTYGYITAVGGQHLRGEDVDWQKRPEPIIDPDYYHGYLKNPSAAPDFKFHAGDLLLTRGYTSAPSALIAQTVESRSHYSHVVFVHVTPEGREMTLEAYSGVGLDKYNIDYALKNENPRIMVIRPKDPELGQKAGDFMYGVVEQSSQSGKKIPFDYYTNTQSHDKVWCGEVAYWAYDEASNHSILLPQYKNAISWKNLGFLNTFKLKQGETYQAGDLEVDSRFDVVLEHRDWEMLQDSRYKDAILREILRWQDDYGYSFHGKLRTAVIDLVAFVRKTPLWPVFKKLGFPDLPNDASTDILITFDRLKRLTPLIYDQLAAADKAHLEKTGWPLTNSELTAEVEAIRERDLVKAKQDGLKKSSFHWLYRPKL